MAHKNGRTTAFSRPSHGSIFQILPTCAMSRFQNINRVHRLIPMVTLTIFLLYISINYEVNITPRKPTELQYTRFATAVKSSPLLPHPDTEDHLHGNEDSDVGKGLNTGAVNFTNAQIDIERWIPPVDELYDRLSIITAISQNHYREVFPWIATIQELMPEKTIILYNLGLDTISLKRVKNLCNVQVREFPFSSYPEHVKNLHTYAWKPIIIDITLREFGAIFWGDASIRLKASLRNLIPISLKHHGYMTHFHGFDPKKKEDIQHQYYFTHPQLYANLGVNRTEYFQSEDSAPHAAANRQLYLNSSYIHETIVQPMLQCALRYRCISPLGAVLGKHRFDASVLAILIYKNLKGEWTRTNNDNRAFDEAVYISRDTVGYEKVQTCV